MTKRRSELADLPRARQMTRAQAAVHCGVNPRTVDRWADSGRITRYKVGGMQWVRFDRAELDTMRRTSPEKSAKPIEVADPFEERPQGRIIR